MSPRVASAFIGAALLFGVAATSQSRAQTAPTFSIDWHVVGPAGGQVRNSCFVVNGTAGQTAPGYSSGGSFALFSGFWFASATAGDEIFLNGFEGCAP